MSIVRPALQFDNVTVITNNILRSADLSPAEKGVLCYILSHKAGYELTMKQVLAENRAGRHAIDSALEGLESRGYLARTRKRDGETGRLAGYDWAVTIDEFGKPQVTPSVGNPDVGKPALAPTCEDDLFSQLTPSAGNSTVGKPAPKKLNLEEVELKELKNLPSPAIAVEELFSRFWANYPKKVNKLDAERKFAIAIKKAPAEDIIEGARLYAEYVKVQQTERRFIKGPDVWLNKGCWTDELTSERIRRAGYDGPYQNPVDDSEYEEDLVAVLRRRRATAEA